MADHRPLKNFDSIFLEDDQLKRREFLMVPNRGLY